MRKPNQIRRDRNAAAGAAQPSKKTETGRRVRVGLWVPNALHAAIEEGAKRLGLTMSAFVEQAIKEVLPVVERKMKGAK